MSRSEMSRSAMSRPQPDRRTFRFWDSLVFTLNPKTLSPNATLSLTLNNVRECINIAG